MYHRLTWCFDSLTINTAGRERGRGRQSSPARVSSTPNKTYSGNENPNMVLCRVLPSLRGETKICAPTLFLKISIALSVMPGVVVK